MHDDGRGLPPGFDPEQTSLGLKIATSLAQGQGGHFRLEQRDGTCATLILPANLVA
ncbi:hypothetical protein [Sphingomonas gellani]|uniref:hypothetical protein n=1 Tax=Sphingomonas gellani TaxID=1166340 RepID=UPI0031387BBE